LLVESNALKVLFCGCLVFENDQSWKWLFMCADEDMFQSSVRLKSGDDSV